MRGRRQGHRISYEVHIDEIEGAETGETERKGE